jgi:predicted metal-dependent hydrolase
LNHKSSFWNYCQHTFSSQFDWEGREQHNLLGVSCTATRSNVTAHGIAFWP